MNNRFKFRAYDTRIKKMIFENEYPGELFKLLHLGKLLIIMQETGLKNDLGKNIYEGDVLKERCHYDGDVWIEDRILLIIFKNGTFLGEVIGEKNRYSDIDYSGIRIIGNIHEGYEDE